MLGVPIMSVMRGHPGHVRMRRASHGMQRGTPVMAFTFVRIAIVFVTLFAVVALGLA